MRRLCLVVAVLFLLTACTPESGASTEKESTPDPVEVAPPPSVVDTGVAALDGPEPGEQRRITLEVDERSREFLLSLPATYTPERGWPVVLAFHGWQSSAEVMSGRSGLHAANAIVVYAQGVTDAWSPAPYARTRTEEDETFVRLILDSLRATYPGNETRIFAVGYSNGGGFASLLGCRAPETFTAVVSVAAAYYQPVYRDCKEGSVAVLSIHGTADSVMGYYGGRRHGALYDAVPEVLAVEAARNNCRDTTTISRMTRTVLHQKWQGCRVPTEHIRIGGGGHSWPGSATDRTNGVPDEFATDAILTFLALSRQPDPAASSEP